MAVRPIVAQALRHGLVAAVVALAGGSAAVAASAVAAGAVAAKPQPAATDPSDARFDRHFADLVLTDQNGRRLVMADLRDQLVLVHFFYTGCTTVCSPQTAQLAAVRRAMPQPLREQVRFVSVSLDPMGDTPAVLRDFAQRLGANQPGWAFVGAPQADVQRLIQRLGLLDRRKASPQVADHLTALWLVDGQGFLRQRYGGVPVDQPRLLRELQTLADMDLR